MTYGNVFDAEKIAGLFAVAETVIAAEQVDVTVYAVLVEIAQPDGCHTDFVLIVYVRKR